MDKEEVAMARITGKVKKALKKAERVMTLAGDVQVVLKELLKEAEKESSGRGTKKVTKKKTTGKRGRKKKVTAKKKKTTKKKVTKARGKKKTATKKTTTAKSDLSKIKDVTELDKGLARRILKAQNVKDGGRGRKPNEDIMTLAARFSKAQLESVINAPRKKRGGDEETEETAQPVAAGATSNVDDEFEE